MVFRKKLLIIAISIVVGLVLAGFCAEIIFFAQNKDWYRNISLQVRQRERVDATKDADLVMEDDKAQLHKAPDTDSALREYVELVNFKKKPGVYRIVCIGGSTTQGVGLAREWKYPYLLQQRLEEAYPGKFEVFNLGLHGKTTEDFLQRFEKASHEANFGWKDLQPDLVILCPVWNDFIIALKSGADDSLWNNLEKFVEKYLSSRFALGHYIYLGLEIAQENLVSRYYDQNEGFFKNKLELEKGRFRSRLGKIIGLWQGQGARVYLLLLPGLVEEGWNDEFLRFLLKKNYGDSPEWFLLHKKFPIIQRYDHEIITAVAEEYKIRCIDASGIAKDFPVEKRLDQRYFIDAIHPGPQITSWISESLSSAITSDLRKQ